MQMRIMVPEGCRYVATENADYLLFICKCGNEMKTKKTGKIECVSCKRSYCISWEIGEIGESRIEPLAYDRWYEGENVDSG